MKNNIIISLVLMLLLATVFVAGCTETENPSVTPTPTQTPTGEIPVPVLTVHVDKLPPDIGSNEYVKYILPGNPTTGYSWLYQDVEGLKITENYIPDEVPEGMVGSGGTYEFLITADAPGTYLFRTVYARAWESVSPEAGINQNIVFGEPVSEPETEPILTLTYDGDVNPSAGEVVKIVVAGNPTTGYSWEVAKDTAVTVLDSQYQPDLVEEGVTGSGGVYIWYVTADLPGTYVFGAEYLRPWEEGYGNRFWFDITFV